MDYDYQVYLLDKDTGEKTMYIDGLSEEEAESICEAWGWNYSDENGKSYWMGYGIPEERIKSLGLICARAIGVA